MADSATQTASAASPTWTPDPNQTYSTRAYRAEDGTERFYTAEEAAELFPAPALDQLKAVKVADVGAQFDARQAAGWSYQGQVIDIDAKSLTNLGGMATTAALVKLDLTPWPADYQTGWITRSGARIPLPAYTDGIPLAAGAAAYYAALAQHGQDLETAALAATDAQSLAAIDETAGWPANTSTAPTG